MDQARPRFPPAGQPGYPWGQPPPYPEPQPRTSRLAITGLILAVFLPLVGLVLSIVAFFKTGPGKLGGRGLAVAGMVTAVVVGAGATVTTVVVLNHRAYPTDPGCIALQHPDTSVKIDPNADAPDFQTFIDVFNNAADKAQRSDVKKAMRTMADDYKYVQDGLSAGARPPGQTPDFNGDLKRVQSLCGLHPTVRVP